MENANVAVGVESHFPHWEVWIEILGVAAGLSCSIGHFPHWEVWIEISY